MEPRSRMKRSGIRDHRSRIPLPPSLFELRRISRSMRARAPLRRHSGAREARTRNPSGRKDCLAMDSGPAPDGASRNDRWEAPAILQKFASSKFSLYKNSELSYVSRNPSGTRGGSRVVTVYGWGAVDADGVGRAEAGP